ncbi:MAG: hypothetical protein K9I34_06155 [Bacteroidales bacterium]|nr:hypothetical protein [Bacteroidales bacterium]
MKPFILFITLVSSIIIFSSCSQCMSCVISGNSLDDSIYVDTTLVMYDDFCGTLSEVDAFEADVKFESDARYCVTYTIRKFIDDAALAVYTKCGSLEDIQAFKVYLEDDVLNSQYAGQDVYLKLDASVPNPGTYNCIKVND